MAKVTIETAELTLSKVVHESSRIDEWNTWNTVSAIIALVDAYDAAHNYKDYSVRKYLLDALQHGG